MTANNGKPGYKVSLLPAAAGKLHALHAAAAARGLADAFRDDLAAVELQLKRTPKTWGDPLYDYHHLDMTRRRGRPVFFYVYYAVNEEARSVFVQDFAANPYGPLAGDPPTG